MLSQPKRLALLVYLRVAAPGGFVARDRLLALFWPESDPERARNALRQSLHFLRRSLGEGAVPSRSDREVGVDAGAVACDAVAFREAIGAGRLEQAVELYRGEFLPGFFVEDAPEIERWIDDQRAELARLAHRAAWTLCERHEARGEMAAALIWARKALAMNPLDEAGARRLRGLLARTGDRPGALEVFQELERRLARELELEPSVETVRLANEIRTQAPQPEPVPAAASAPTPASTDAPADRPVNAGADATAGAPVPPAPAPPPHSPPRTPRTPRTRHPQPSAMRPRPHPAAGRRSPSSRPPRSRSSSPAGSPSRAGAAGPP